MCWKRLSALKPGRYFKNFPGNIRGALRIAGIIIRADPERIIRSQNSSADHDPTIRPGSPEMTNGFLHGGKRGGHEGGEPYEPDFLLKGGFHDFFRRNVPAQVQHGISIVLQNHADDIFPNIVDVSKPWEAA